MDAREFLKTYGSGEAETVCSRADLETMARIRSVLDPAGCLNPGKLIPMAAAG